MEQSAQSEPMVRPRRTIRAWIKHFRCKHHWVWNHPGDGIPWLQCSLCKWVYVDKCDKYGHDWQRVDAHGAHWFACSRCAHMRACKICGWM